MLVFFRVMMKAELNPPGAPPLPPAGGSSTFLTISEPERDSICSSKSDFFVFIFF